MAYIEDILIKDVIQVYIKEVFIKYKILDKIISDRDTRFILIF